MDVHISNQPEKNFLCMFTGDVKHMLVSRNVKTITLQKVNQSDQMFLGK